MIDHSYTSHADLGGRLGFGAVTPEPEDHLFDHDWEKRALGLTLAAGGMGLWTIDASRSARETLPDYLNLSYYQIWLSGLAKLLAANGLANDRELETGAIEPPVKPVSRILKAQDVANVLAKGSPYARAVDQPPKFAIGQTVRTLASITGHHTRLPHYARAKTGVVEAVHGAHVFADTNAHGQGEQPQFLYTVRFPAVLLWPEETGLTHSVSIDAFEPYLEAE